MPLKSETVDWLFARFGVRYGAAWRAKWAGVPMEAVAMDWATELDRVPRDSILYALGYLPLEFPPTAAQFKAICLRCPTPNVVALPGPKADPQRVAAMIGLIRTKLDKRPRLQWAHDLAEREKAGQRLTPVQSAAWREALDNAPTPSIAGLYTPIDPKCLPPAIRVETGAAA
jgi:hypothetical protein